MRKINNIILHCSATKEGKDYTVDQIRKWHLDQGFSDIGYHYVIYRDGSVHKGRPIEKVGAHCSGHNAYSVGICYIGGLDANGKAKDTRTVEQKKALCKLVRYLMIKFSISYVHCHNEYAAKDCPCFSINTFMKELKEYNEQN